MSQKRVFTAANILSEIIAEGVTADTVARPSLAVFNGERVLLGVSPDKKLSLMIPVESSNESDLDETLTSSLSIKAIEKLTDSNQLKKFLTLQTTSEFDVALFGALCDEAISGLGDTQEARDLLRSIVNHWRKLLDSMSEKSFGTSKAVGLFGELVFLNLFHKKCGDAALNAWVGPEGGRHDFLFQSAAVEVKSTTRTDSLIAEIHGIDQFDDIPGRDKWLGFAQIEWDPSGISLSELIETSRNLFQDKSKFDGKLALLGISDVSMLNPGYIFSEKQIFLNEVDDTFPFIAKQDIEAIIDIGRLQGFGYAVNLDGLCRPLAEESITKVLSKGNS